MELWRANTSPDPTFPHLYRGWISRFLSTPVEAEHLRPTETMAMQDAIAMALNRKRPGNTPHVLRPCTVAECDCWGKRRPTEDN